MLGIFPVLRCQVKRFAHSRGLQRAEKDALGVLVCLTVTMSCQLSQWYSASKIEHPKTGVRALSQRSRMTRSS